MFATKTAAGWILREIVYLSALPPTCLSPGDAGPGLAGGLSLRFRITVGPRSVWIGGNVGGSYHGRTDAGSPKRSQSQSL